MIQILTKRILNETGQTKRKLSVLGFDELNVLNQTDALYAAFAKECRGALREVCRMRYEEVWVWLKGTLPDEDMLDELVDMVLAGLWDEPNENTHYAFGSELERKRDRAKEAVVSVPTKVQKQLELDKAARFVIQQSAWYCDFASQDAELQAMKDAGVQKVRWNIYGDEKVCKQCFDLDGKVFPVSKVPPRPHINCRCYLTPV